ncbi:hypothetical protein [Rhizobium skierniewicense]|uniref:hypothetical protein n=1 Tax=Rhizobium skierniewicense TaxID=984260 RepID=UPI001574AA31|nr:hypothetical protein [Rhizobium skierniewicense]NTF34272.1 hypothetical protein [Rhizobium skierniewicense]
MFDIFPAISAFLVSVGINPAHFFAGAAGALVRVAIQGKKFTFEIFTGAFAGSLCAVYLAPLVARWIGLNPIDAAANGGLAFVLGMIGLSIAEGLVRVAQRWAANPKLPRVGVLSDARDMLDVSEDRNKRKHSHEDE